MRIESDNPTVHLALADMARAVLDGGGWIDPDFVVREADGYLSAAVGRTASSADGLLIAYSPALRPPIHLISWLDRDDEIVATQSAPTLTSIQERLLDSWITILNSTDKVALIRRSVPRFALTNWDIRHHLANAGYVAMRQAPTTTDARKALMSWHSASSDTLTDRQPKPIPASGESPLVPESKVEPGDEWYLIPLKCFVNHHPSGAVQNPVPGRVAVAAATPTRTDETFENYGDLDAMQLLMNFGYLDGAAPLVHSVPVEVESAHLGRVVVRWRAPRNPRGSSMARDVPTLRPTDDGLELHHLTARPNNRGRILMFLAMAARARAGLSQAEAHTEAELVVDAIAQANLDYYRRLDELVVAAMASPAPPIAEGFGTQEILPTIAAMSLLQQQRLNQMWGT